MKQALIDIGSNSVRLTVYDIRNSRFKILFREKHMVGLAGYVSRKKLQPQGIECAVDALLDFRRTLTTLRINQVAVFATASLRNVSNTKEAVERIEAVTGFNVEVISGEEEARLGYAGAMQELLITDGAFIDIGGASTEVVLFKKGKAEEAASFGVGSLSLYRRCVKKIMPGKAGMSRIETILGEEIDQKHMIRQEKRTPIIGVGGTARAVLKISKKYFGLQENSVSVTAAQVRELLEVLSRGDRKAIDLILRNDADRIHTIVPGMMILVHIMDYLESEELIVSRYGVREGYLCQRILTNDISTRRIAN